MARLYSAVFACVGWFALILQYGLTISGNPHMGAGELTLNFFSYFTILSNILAALALTAPVVAPNSRLGRWSASEGVRAAVAMFIVVVGVVYHFLLAGIWAPQGWSLLANNLLHYVMPAAFVADWLFFTPKGRLRWIDPVKWVVPVLIYGGWTLLHGKLSGWWPYWFTDVGKLGLGKVMLYFTGLLVFFLIVGLIVVAVDRTFGRRDRRLASA
ncbi:Pr6Pr family membrane protein [Brevundimonas pondensis]|uniref:Pr6Pr family membrane protein n=1 Tax=Brevundimonas pondensis TaxID=2774189 RepID=A0ABX7SH63_9CAUL|nr:Pr6Pr family membrane protein [Brevundimonas pondensis]QTC86966.1 Pr6Pr family membrane protein [Brevundimonas pondensis]